MTFDAVFEAIGGFGTYQVVSMIWFQSVIWLMVPNVAFMVFGGIPEKFHCEWNETLVESNDSSRSVPSYVLRSIEVLDPQELVSSDNQTSGQSYSCQLLNPGQFYSVLMDWSLRGRLGLKLAAWMTTAQMLGVFFGPLISGQLSDHFGRRRVLLLFYICLMTFCGSSAFVSGWRLFLAMRFLIGLAQGGLQSVHFVMIQELLLPKWRLAIYIGDWPLAYMFAGFLAYFTNHWKWYTIAATITGIPGLLLSLFWIDESPKWLLEKKRIDEAMHIIRKIAAINGVQSMPDLSKLLGQFNSEQEQELDESQTKAALTSRQPGGNSKLYTYYHLFRNKTATAKTLALASSWLTTGTVYYALLFNVKSLMGNPAINIVILGALRLVIQPFMILLDRTVPMVGRRMFQQFGLLTVSAATLTMAMLTLFPGYLNANQSGVSKVLLLLASVVGTTACSPLWTAIECFTAEIFPTALRTMGNAFCSSAARIGTSVSPQLLLLALVWPPLPFFVLATLAVVNFFVAYFLLPETKGKPLPDMNDNSVELDYVDSTRNKK